MAHLIDNIVYKLILPCVLPNSMIDRKIKVSHLLILRLELTHQVQFQIGISDLAVIACHVVYQYFRLPHWLWFTEPHSSNFRYLWKPYFKSIRSFTTPKFHHQRSLVFTPLRPQRSLRPYLLLAVPPPTWRPSIEGIQPPNSPGSVSLEMSSRMSTPVPIIFYPMTASLLTSIAVSEDELFVSWMIACLSIIEHIRKSTILLLEIEQSQFTKSKQWISESLGYLKVLVRDTQHLSQYHD
jgi:hypothetical protein